MKDNYFGNFNELIEAILSKKDLDSLLEELLKRLTDLFGAERATFYFYNDITHELWSYIATDLEIEAIRVPLGKGVAGRAAKERKVINVRDAYEDKFFNAQVDKKTGFKTRNILAAPLVNKEGQLLGVVQILNKKESPFTGFDADFLKSISYYIVIALENIKLLQEKEAFVRSTIYALTSALDAKDPVTSGHSYRVAYFSLKIAQALGFAEDSVSTLEYAAYLHDIGKIGVSDAILQKKDRLSVSEYQEMKRHPLYTQRILKNIIFPKANARTPDIASAHHEFLDGSGYPSGSKGKNIDMLSRIIAVADIYDALVSFDRPYKKHLSLRQALGILKEEAEKNHLDKKIVQAFINKGLYKYERRKFQRLDLNVTVNFQIIPQRKVIKDRLREMDKTSPSDFEMLKLFSGRTKNISKGGLLLLIKEYLPLGTYLDLGLKVRSLKFRCIGKVVWIDKVVGTQTYRVGVTFVDLSESLRERLGKKISVLPEAKE